MASQGWTEAFTGTNVACFKSSDVTSNGHYLRVDDSVATPLRVIGYESMTAHRIVPYRSVLRSEIGSPKKKAFVFCGVGSVVRRAGTGDQ